MASVTAKHYEVILYEEDGWDQEKVKTVVENWHIIETYAFILHNMDVDENGNPKKAHYHVYISFGKTSTSIASVASHFGIGENLVNKIESNRYLTLLYFLHIGTRKHVYPIEEMVANFDVLAYLNRQKKTGLDQLLRDCAAGKITRANMGEAIPDELYVKYRSQFEAAFALADERFLMKQIDRDTVVIWVYGASGMGKTTLCKLSSAHQGLAVYVTANGSDPFSKYRDQPAIILDELRPKAQYTYVDLLQILDPHTAAATHCRYFDKVLKAKVIWITSIYSPTEFYKALDLNQEESAVQLYRRIREVWHVDEQSITISRYDRKTGCFVEDQNSVQNPVPVYLAAQAPAQKTTIDSVALLDDIAKQYQAAAPAASPAPANGQATDHEEEENLPFPDPDGQVGKTENLSLFHEAD